MTKSKPKLAFAKYIYETVIYDNRGIECQRLLFGYSMRSDNRDIIGVYDEKNDRVVIMLIHHAAFYYIPPKADKIKHVYATPYSYMKISMVWLPSGQLWLLGGKRTNVRLIQMGYSRHYPFTKATQLVDIVNELVKPGPELPRYMTRPCVMAVDSNSTYFIASNDVPANDSFAAFIFHFAGDGKWLDVAEAFPCPASGSNNTLCAKIDRHIVVPTVNKNGRNFCTALFNLERYEWSKLEGERDLGVESNNREVFFSASEKEAILLHDKDIYSISESGGKFNWEFQGDMEIDVNVTNFLFQIDKAYCAEQHAKRFYQWPAVGPFYDKKPRN